MTFNHAGQLNANMGWGNLGQLQGRTPDVTQKASGKLVECVLTSYPIEGGGIRRDICR
ncbi:MAG: hypothetical protein ACYTGS_15655 [Planctomycetota bacterium]